MPAFLIFDRGSEVFPLRVLVVNPDFLQICPRDGDRNGIARAMSMFISCLLAGLGYEWENFPWRLWRLHALFFFQLFVEKSNQVGFAIAHPVAYLERTKIAAASAIPHGQCSRRDIQEKSGLLAIQQGFIEQGKVVGNVFSFRVFQDTH